MCARERLHHNLPAICTRGARGAGRGGEGSRGRGRESARRESERDSTIATRWARTRANYTPALPLGSLSISRALMWNLSRDGAGLAVPAAQCTCPPPWAASTAAVTCWSCASGELWGVDGAHLPALVVGNGPSSPRTQRAQMASSARAASPRLPGRSPSSTVLVVFVPLCPTTGLWRMRDSISTGSRAT